MISLFSLFHEIGPFTLTHIDFIIVLKYLFLKYLFSSIMTVSGKKHVKTFENVNRH